MIVYDCVSCPFRIMPAVIHQNVTVHLSWCPSLDQVTWLLGYIMPADLRHGQTGMIVECLPGREYLAPLNTVLAVICKPILHVETGENDSRQSATNRWTL